MKSETIIEVVDKLIGDIEPIGETYRDNKSYDNLRGLLKVHYHLFRELTDLLIFVDRYEHSMKRTGMDVYKYLDELHEELSYTLSGYDYLKDNNNDTR